MRCLGLSGSGAKALKFAGTPISRAVFTYLASLSADRKPTWGRHWVSGFSSSGDSLPYKRVLGA